MSPAGKRAESELAPRSWRVPIYRRRHSRDLAFDCFWIKSRAKNLEVTIGIEPIKNGFANRPVSHFGTSPLIPLAYR